MHTCHKQLFPFVQCSQESFLTKEVESIFCLKVYYRSTGGRIFIADALLFPTKKVGLFQSIDGLNTCMFQSQNNQFVLNYS